MVGTLALSALLWMAEDRLVAPVPLCGVPDGSPISASSVVVDPQDADLVLVAADTVYRSTSRGDCLSPANVGLVTVFPIYPRPVIPWVLTVDPQTPDTVYAGTNEGVYRSRDGGRSWDSRNPVPFVLGEAHVGCIAVDPDRPNIVYAGGETGIYKSEDGGESWATINNGFIVPPIVSPGTAALAFDPRDTDIVYVASIGIFRTTDGGGLWSPMNHGLPSGPIFEVAVNAWSPDIVYAGTADGLFRSSDAGGSWGPSGLSGRAVYSVEQDPSNAAILFAGTDAGAFRSGDFGNNWSPVASPFSNAVVRRIAIAPSDSASIYAATDAGVYRSRDGGASWEPFGIDHRQTRVIWTRESAQ